MARYKKKLTSLIISLRKQGKTYSEISNIIGKPIAKSTISYWCKDVNTSPAYNKRIQIIIAEAGKRGRQNALSIIKKRREKYLESIRDKVAHLSRATDNTDTAKIVLAILYLCEGKKKSLTFGNSDPGIISMFLSLIRSCYKLNEAKFRCTVQCRADQNTKNLEKFWLNITKIPKKQFYKAQIDPRTNGKTTKKPNYKGVCRIDYFSGDIYNELKIIAQLLTDGFYDGPLAQGVERFYGIEEVEGPIPSRSTNV